MNQAKLALHECNNWPSYSTWLMALSEEKLFSAWAVDQYVVPENPRVYRRLPGEIKMAGTFKIVIPVTGGMDSTALWLMAKDAGLPIVPVYVFMGQEYADVEYKTACELTNSDVARLNMCLPNAKKFKHIILGRNATVIWTIAEFMKRAEFWGEIWLGNLAGEMPAVAGDKSYRFLSTTQQMLTLASFDVKLSTPLQTMDKPDIVRWAQDNKYVDILLKTKSCFHPTELNCGECQSCFRKWVAFICAGIYPGGIFQNPRFDEHVAKYEPLMLEALANKDYSRYSPKRCRETLNAIAFWKVRSDVLCL